MLTGLNFIKFYYTCLYPVTNLSLTYKPVITVLFNLQIEALYAIFLLNFLLFRAFVLFVP